MRPAGAWVRLSGFWLCLLLIAAAGPVHGEPAAALDPVVRKVVEMLGSGVAPDLVLDWIEREQPRPARVGPEELVALSRARAPRSLIDALIARLEPGPPRKEAASSGEEKVPVEFQFLYRPQVTEGEEGWDLIAYIDGHPLTWVDGRGGLLAKHELSFRRHLLPGRHVLRLLQERHRQRSLRSKLWVHQARVCPERIEFEIDPGEGWSLRVELKQSRFHPRRGPLSWYLTRQSGVVARQLDAGPAPGDWPFLCEEIEAGLRSKKKVPNALQRKLRHCVRWPSLWPAEPPPPSRRQVREELARFDFKPIPVGAR